MKTTTGPLSATEPVAPLPVQAQSDRKATFIGARRELAHIENYLDGVDAPREIKDRMVDLRACIGELAASPTAAQAQPVAGDERTLIGRLLDEMSQLQILWGLNEPGGLLRFSDVSNVLFAAGKLAATQPAAASESVDLQAAILQARAEGRAEAVEIIVGMDAEDALNDLTKYSLPVGPVDEGSTEWDIDKLRATFKADDKLYNAFATAEEMYWEYREAAMVLQYEAEQRCALAANKPAAPAAANDQRSLQIIAGCATDDLGDIRAELGLSDDDCIDAVLETIRELKGSAASAAQPVAEPEEVRALDSVLGAIENNDMITAMGIRGVYADDLRIARAAVDAMVAAATQQQKEG